MVQGMFFLPRTRSLLASGPGVLDSNSCRDSNQKSFTHQGMKNTRFGVCVSKSTAGGGLCSLGAKQNLPSPGEQAGNRDISQGVQSRTRGQEGTSDTDGSR